MGLSRSASISAASAVEAQSGDAVAESRYRSPERRASTVEATLVGLAAPRDLRVVTARWMRASGESSASALNAAGLSAPALSQRSTLTRSMAEAGVPVVRGLATRGRPDAGNTDYALPEVGRAGPRGRTHRIRDPGPDSQRTPIRRATIRAVAEQLELRLL